jgi:hypothetical protein
MMQACDTAAGGTESWNGLIRRLPLDPPADSLLSRQAFLATLVRLYDMRSGDAVAVLAAKRRAPTPPSPAVAARAALEGGVCLPT